MLSPLRSIYYNSISWTPFPLILPLKCNNIRFRCDKATIDKNMAEAGHSLRTAETTQGTPKASAKPNALPSTKDLTIENITENVIAVNSQGKDPRTSYVLERLVSHLHDFARETRLSTDEWMAGIQFLTRTGQISTEVRQVNTVYSRGVTHAKQDAGVHPSLGHLWLVVVRYALITSAEYRLHK